MYGRSPYLTGRAIYVDFSQKRRAAFVTFNEGLSVRASRKRSKTKTLALNGQCQKLAPASVVTSRHPIRAPSMGWYKRNWNWYLVRGHWGGRIQNAGLAQKFRETRGTKKRKALKRDRGGRWPVEKQNGESERRPTGGIPSEEGGNSPARQVRTGPVGMDTKRGFKERSDGHLPGTLLSPFMISSDSGVSTS